MKCLKERAPSESPTEPLLLAAFFLELRSLFHEKKYPQKMQDKALHFLFARVWTGAHTILKSATPVNTISRAAAGAGETGETERST